MRGGQPTRSGPTNDDHALVPGRLATLKSKLLGDEGNVEGEYVEGRGMKKGAGKGVPQDGDYGI